MLKSKKIKIEKLTVEVREFKIDTPFSFSSVPKIDSVNGRPVYIIDGTYTRPVPELSPYPPKQKSIFRRLFKRNQ